MSKDTNTRVLFFGTPEFALPTLDAVNEAFEIPLVITTPDRPRNRGRVTPTPVKKRAFELGLEVFDPEKINTLESVDRLRATKADFAVVAAYGNLIGQEILALLPDKILNIHPSLLPLYRGASPLEHAILTGDEYTGSSIMLLERGLDSGDVLIQTRVPLNGMDIEALHDKLAQIGAQDIVRALKDYEKYYAARKPQGNDYTYAKKLTREDGYISWERSNVEIDRLVRALHVAPGVMTQLGSTMYKLHAGNSVEGKGKPGEILSAGKDGIVVACGQGAYRITVIQKAGSRKMDIQSFLTGNQLRQGMLFQSL